MFRGLASQYYPVGISLHYVSLFRLLALENAYGAFFRFVHSTEPSLFCFAKPRIQTQSRQQEKESP